MSNSSRNLKKELATIGTVNDLTGVFENLASIQIRATRQKVLQSKLYFNDLWALYSQLRADMVGSSKSEGRTLDRDLLIAVTSPLGLSGEVDNRLIQQLRTENDLQKNDVLVVGSHGFAILEQLGVKPVRSFEAPDVTKPFGVDAILDTIKKYRKSRVYYNAYISLTTQQVTDITLLVQAQQLTEDELKMIEHGETSIISSRNYIFEPSSEVVVQSIEEIMLNTSLTQILLESRLSQAATRFTTMTLAHQRAGTTKKKANLEYLAARRVERDESTRQIITAARMMV